MTNEYDYDTAETITTQPKITVSTTATGENTSTATTPTGQRLRAYIDRVERLEEDKKAVMEDLKEVYDEAKGDGFDVKAMRKIVSLRKKDPSDRAEEEAILETYMAALGMA